MKKIVCIAVLIAAMCAAMSGCGNSGTSTEGSKPESTKPESSHTESSQTESSQTDASSEQESIDEPSKAEGIDYMALVNKLNPLPEGWEDALETTTIKNSVGVDVQIEKKAYEAYEKLKADLEKEGIYVDLDSAFRSVAEQQRIMDEFIVKYGADYAAKTVAQPGYSEHHTGLALDFYLIIDGAEVDENEDMMQYPEIWAKIHEKLPEYGFILRYLDGKEHITGYGYEPWHMRYIDDVEKAREIMSKGITFEEYLGTAKTTDVKIDYGTSELFTEDELKEAAVQIKCMFASFGCELQSLRYVGDETNNEENLARMNTIDEGKNYTQVIEFVSDFHTPAEGTDVFEGDKDIKDYSWWLARKDNGGWQLITWGFGE